MRGVGIQVVLASFVVGLIFISLSQANEMLFLGGEEELSPFNEDLFLPEESKSCQFLGVNEQNPLAPFQFECQDMLENITQFSCRDMRGERCVPNVEEGIVIL